MPRLQMTLGLCSPPRCQVPSLLEQMLMTLTHMQSIHGSAAGLSSCQGGGYCTPYLKTAAHAMPHMGSLACRGCGADAAAASSGGDAAGLQALRRPGRCGTLLACRVQPAVLLSMVKSPCKWCMASPAKPDFMFAAVATAVGPFQYPDLRSDLQVRSPTSSALAAALARLRALTQQRPSSRLQCTGDTARAIG